LDQPTTNEIDFELLNNSFENSYLILYATFYDDKKMTKKEQENCLVSLDTMYKITNSIFEYYDDLEVVKYYIDLGSFYSILNIENIILNKTELSTSKHRTISEDLLYEYNNIIMIYRILLNNKKYFKIKKYFLAIEQTIYLMLGFIFGITKDNEEAFYDILSRSDSYQSEYLMENTEIN